jgi:hypothetical protein
MEQEHELQPFDFEVVGLTYDFQPLMYAKILVSLVRPWDSGPFTG